MGHEWSWHDMEIIDLQRSHGTTSSGGWFHLDGWSHGISVKPRASGRSSDRAALGDRLELRPVVFRSPPLWKMGFCYGIIINNGMTYHVIVVIIPINTYIDNWLVVYLPTPLKNDGVRQLGWWHSQYDGKVIKKCSKPPTRYRILHRWSFMFQSSSIICAYLCQLQHNFTSPKLPWCFAAAPRMLPFPKMIEFMGLSSATSHIHWLSWFVCHGATQWGTE